MAQPVGLDGRQRTSHATSPQAVQRLHISSPAVRLYPGLERELGAALFMRTTRRVTLTQAGHALLPEARRTLAAA